MLKKFTGVPVIALVFASFIGHSAYASTSMGFDSIGNQNIFAVNGQAAITVNADTDPSHNPPAPSVVISGPIKEGNSVFTTDGKMGIGVGASALLGDLDVENGANTAKICLNGSCMQSAAPVMYTNSSNVPTYNPNWGYMDLSCVASCPVGGHAVSGGCGVGGSHWSSINGNLPSGNSSWFCSSHTEPEFPMNPPSDVDTLYCYVLCQ